MGNMYSKISVDKLIGQTVLRVSVIEPSYDTVDYENVWSTPGYIVLETASEKYYGMYMDNRGQVYPRGSIVDNKGTTLDSAQIPFFTVKTIDKRTLRNKQKYLACLSSNSSFFCLTDTRDNCYSFHVDDFYTLKKK